MIELQVISKILDTKQYFLADSEEEITSEYFVNYTQEFEFIQSHYKQYNSVPDVETFLSKFPDIELVAVSEDNDYLLDELNHEHLYNKLLPVFKQGFELFEEGKLLEACDVMMSDIPKAKEVAVKPEDIGVIESVDERIHDYEFANQNPTANFIPTGFDEIDNDIVGLQRGDEFVVFYARTNMGKSWVVEYIGTNIVEQGLRVGYFSPEMSKKDIGYRFDTLHGKISNSAMRFGKVTDEFNLDVYKEYGESLKQLRGEMFVATPTDFQRKLTVTKLKEWKERRNLDVIIIDGITYLTDERFKKGDSKTTSLTNISEDLMTLSGEVGVPVVVVVQANRGGVIDKSSLDTPELENIRDSDGIAMNASKVYAVKQMRRNDTVTLVIENKKSRGTKMGQVYTYTWDIDTGTFVYVDKESLETGDDNDYESPSDNPRDKKREAKRATGGAKRQQRNISNEDDY